MNDFEELLKLFGQCIYVLFYPATIILVTLFLNLGVYNWLIIALLLTPPTVIWYVIVKKRAENYLKILFEPPRVWELDEKLHEYIEMLKRRKGN